MQKYRLLIAYDGTSFGGWQSQINATSIQALIEKALSTFLRGKTAIIGSGRTDAGVHALGQIAHFTLDQIIDPRRFLYSINALLPPAIRILKIDPVSDAFHARYSAISKVYHYHLHLDRIQNPFNRLYSTYFPRPLDLDLFTRASLYFIGTYDFTAFANDRKDGREIANPVRTLNRLDIIPIKGGLRMEFEGSGFLYKMVRNIVGTLLEVGEGKISCEEIPTIFASKNRALAGECAPPQGLFLMEVHYPDQFEGIASKEEKCEAPDPSGL